MGVVPYKTFTFDGVSSDTYGVYLTGEGVFNAPERDVEMVEVYGRNGDFALDHGRFKNITVTYKAGMFGTDESNFATKISNFRNWLCSKKGYCRLSDDYNPNEYRMAVYSAGLNVDHDFLIAGEFEITFECKPQRWLTSGETKTTLVSGNAITNPTLFPSSPQFQAYGYGDIDIDGQIISVEPIPIGRYVAANGGISTRDYLMVSLNQTFANTGDLITVGGTDTYVKAIMEISQSYPNITIQSISGTQSISSDMKAECSCRLLSSRSVEITLHANSDNAYTFTKGTDALADAKVDMSIVTNNGTVSGPAYVQIGYYNSGRITLAFSNTMTYFNNSPTECLVSCGDVFIDSTQTTTTECLYIDLDIGEAYLIKSGSALSINNLVTLPPELPTLQSGATTITFDNTFTKVDIVPRWWKV